MSAEYFVHESSYVDTGAVIGAGSRIWHFCHIMPDTGIGENCSIGQNVVIGPRVRVGNSCKIQNNVSVYEGVTLEDGVFCGPSMVFTNIHNPRAEIRKMDQVRPTLVKRGATLGANCTIVCGVTIGRYAFVSAGAVVTKDVPDYTLVMGVPGKRAGWISRHGHRLDKKEDHIYTCPESLLRYREDASGRLYCMDLAESASLPDHLSLGKKEDRRFKP